MTEQEENQILMRGEQCGEEMIWWKVWTLTHGVLYYLPDDVPDGVES